MTMIPVEDTKQQPMSEQHPETREPESFPIRSGPQPNVWVVALISLLFIAASGAALGSQGSLAAAISCAVLWWLWALWKFRRNHFAIFCLVLIPLLIVLLTPAIKHSP
jgi:hypothetical protein